MAIRQFGIDSYNNLKGGLRLALLLPVTRPHFSFSQPQLIAMIMLGLSLDILGDWLNVTPPVEFNYYGVNYLLSVYLINLASLYIISLIYRQSHFFYQILILEYASYPVVFLVSLLLAEPLAESTDLATASIIILALLCWSLVILYRIINLLFDSHWWLVIASLATYLILNLSAYLFLPEQPLWYGDMGAADTAHLKSINTENTYYRQTPLLQEALHFVPDSNPDKQEYYFLGFAPDATQDVFLKESQTVQDLIDQLLGTGDRSLLLANHVDTYLNHPLANMHNLNTALNDFSRKMGDEDILLLFLTAHGSKIYELSVNFANMQFNDLPASKLANMLDKTGIGWRIIVVSACYAGGFIDQLKNPKSLIVTAAARDRQSSGCTDESEATWFTDAYFKQALPQTRSFITAFQVARESIELREKREGIEFSNPQIFIGDQIRAKLEGIPVDGAIPETGNKHETPHNL
jgi:hypothetical protein